MKKTAWCHSVEGEALLGNQSSATWVSGSETPKEHFEGNAWMVRFLFGHFCGNQAQPSVRFTRLGDCACKLIQPIQFSDTALTVAKSKFTPHSTHETYPFQHVTSFLLWGVYVNQWKAALMVPILCTTLCSCWSTSNIHVFWVCNSHVFVCSPPSCQQVGGQIQSLLGVKKICRGSWSSAAGATKTLGKLLLLWLPASEGLMMPFSVTEPKLANSRQKQVFFTLDLSAHS